MKCNIFFSMQGRMYTAYQTYYGAPVASVAWLHDYGYMTMATLSLALRTCAPVASVAWPQQLTSTVGVNHRRWYEPPPSGTTNAVSERLFSAA